MEQRKTRIADNRTDEFSSNEYKTAGDSDDNQRLNQLLRLNAETIRAKENFKSEFEQFEVDLMKNPLNAQQAFAYFGLMLGSIPQLTTIATIIYKLPPHGDFGGIIAFGLVITLITSVVGYFTGKRVGITVSNLEEDSWTKMILLTPFVGLLWGLITGGAGGVIVFIIGAIFGGIVGGAVGFAALPVFTVFHRLLKKGEFIETNHFLPLAFGIIFIICGLIVGY